MLSGESIGYSPRTTALQLGNMMRKYVLNGFAH